ncbi:MAG: hypothetical protein WC665_01490 [Sulfurimonas sp.]|jgi:nitrous oxide reductase accessory protein NosL
MLKYKLLLSTFYSLLVVSLFVGCNEESKTKMAEVHWDRDMCARCVMVISDRKNSIQVKNPDNAKTYMFDDIGCMALWFEDEKIEWKDKALIWITDSTTGEWIDARSAFYDTENITPMAYGFCSHKAKNGIKENQEIIDFNEVLKRVVKNK